jgi:uncharacterized coiled-coil protein SlyX
VTLGEREGLVARIRQIRRVAASGERSVAPAGADEGANRVDALETRVAHLEHLVQGFQDSVHRESERHDKLIAELQAQVEPTAMSATLSKHARDHGL